MNASNYVKIALFFIIIGAGGGAYIIISANGLSGFSTAEYETVISDATGLSSRSKIYQAGVVVGRVKGVTLDGNKAVLKLSFLKDLKLHEGSVISRRSSSILGTSILTLEPGNVSNPVIPPGGKLVSGGDTGDMEAVINTAQDLIAQISKLLKDFQDNQLALLSISLETFNSIAFKVNAESEAGLDRVSRILESVALITERMEGFLARSNKTETGPVADIYGALENVRAITEEIAKGRGNLGQAVFDDQLYASLLSTMRRIESSVEKLQGALDTVNAAASSAGKVIDNAGIVLEKTVGLGVQVDASGSFYASSKQVQAGASLRIIPASNDRWYRIGVSSAPNGYSTHTVSEITDANGARIKDITKTDYTSFLLDVELARQIGIFTLRGGLLENTGGAGFDIQPLRWVSVSGEVFNFKPDGLPNLRGTLTVYPFFDADSDKPWNWLYVKGGINDSLNDSREFFVGGGVRFADHEVKGLVGLIPALGK
ncbi:MAG: MlaD family protein [Treponema sp.]|jgi:phospholipid/cholesterol/gamma-HCH transport system substrate-binding protein|nr:MlaD family protein [Treponema sp.]